MFRDQLPVVEDGSKNLFETVPRPRHAMAELGIRAGHECTNTKDFTIELEVDANTLKENMWAPVLDKDYIAYYVRIYIGKNSDHKGMNA